MRGTDKVRKSTDKLNGNHEKIIQYIEERGAITNRVLLLWMLISLYSRQIPAKVACQDTDCDYQEGAKQHSVVGMDKL